MRGGRSARGPYVLVTAVVLLATVGSTYVFGRAFHSLSLQKAPFGRLAYVPSFDPVEDVTLGLPMDAGNGAESKTTASIRAIEVFPTQVLLLAGGRAVRAIELAKPVASLHELVHIVASPGWISEAATTITLHSAVIAGVGGSLTVAAPTTTEVVMQVRPGVFLAAVKAKLTLTGVYFHASNPATPKAGSRTARHADLGRPFILASDASTMTIKDSTFRYLGRDWNSSYGLAWSKGSSGSITGSLFEHNFIGIYTDHSIGLKIQHNRFYYNSLYGIDPHSFSSRLLVEYNISNFNGRHGIIFSDHVTHGVIRYNMTAGNGLNGIMLDEASSDNTVDGNTVTDSKSDGIVVADSASNTITRNRISHNRVGIHVRGGTSIGTVLAHNRISNNDVAAQGANLDGNASFGNGGQWSSSRIIAVWTIAVAVWLALLVLTWVSRRNTSRHAATRRTRRSAVG